MFSRVVGRVANVFALLDGFQKLSQVVRNARLGLPYTAQLVAGGLMIIGPIVGILVASFVGAVVGVLIALVGLILGAIFVTLVPPAVIMWLNRSYFRNDGVGIYCLLTTSKKKRTHLKWYSKTSPSSALRRNNIKRPFELNVHLISNDVFLGGAHDQFKV